MPVIIYPLVWILIVTYSISTKKTDWQEKYEKQKIEEQIEDTIYEYE